jgi:hypothetical protein
MTIKVIKTASNVKPTGYCVQFVDDPPIAKRSAAATKK